MFKKILIFLAFVLIFSLIYSPALFKNYVYCDDFTFWMPKAHEFINNSFVSHLTISGRPLAGVLHWLSGQFVHKTRDLNILRFFSLLTLSFTAWIVWVLFKKYFNNELDAALFVVLFSTLPYFEITMAWAASIPTQAALIFALLSIVTQQKVLNEPRWRIFYKNKYVWASVGFFYSGLLSYPPSAIFFWAIGGMILFFLRNESLLKIQWKARNLFRVGLTAYLLYGLTLLAIKPFSGTRSLESAYNPYVVSVDVIGKVKWFFQEPFIKALNLWNDIPSANVAYCVLGFMGLSLMAYVYRSTKDKSILEKKIFWARWFFLGGVTFLLFLLSFSPNLLAKESVSYHRNLGGMVSLIFFSVFMSIQFWISLLPIKLRKATLRIVLIGGCLWAGHLAHVNLDQRVVGLAQREFKFIREKLEQNDLTAYSKIVFLRSKYYAELNHRGVNEFQQPIVSIHYFYSYILNCVFNEMGYSNKSRVEDIIILRFLYPGTVNYYDHYFEIRKFITDKEPRYVPKPGDLVIDWEEFMRSEAERERK